MINTLTPTFLKIKVQTVSNGLLRAVFVASLLVVTLPGGSHALAQEHQEKIYINADRMRLNIETGNSVYIGHVRISQGKLVLTGDRVTIKQDDDKIERITVTGKPAHYTHVTEKGETIEAESEHMVYTASQHQLVMTVNARLKQPDHQVNSEKIIYDTEKKLVLAGKVSEESGGLEEESEDSLENQRVKIILTPKTSPSENKPASNNEDTPAK